MKLFLIHVGFYDTEIMDGIYEQHSNYFVAAENIKDAKNKSKKLKELFEINKSWKENQNYIGRIWAWLIEKRNKTYC